MLAKMARFRDIRFPKNGSPADKPPGTADILNLPMDTGVR